MRSDAYRPFGMFTTRRESPGSVRVNRVRIKRFPKAGAAWCDGRTSGNTFGGCPNDDEEYAGYRGADKSGQGRRLYSREERK